VCVDIHQVYAMPTLVFIKDGKIQQRSEGAMLAPKIKDLTEHIFFDGVPSPSVHAADTLLFAAMLPPFRCGSCTIGLPWRSYQVRT